MTNWPFLMTGGFWSGVAVTGPPVVAPLLTVELGGGSVRGFWPLPAAGFVLDQAAALAAPAAAIAWSQVAFPYLTHAMHISTTVPAPVGSRYYRLRKP